VQESTRREPRQHSLELAGGVGQVFKYRAERREVERARLEGRRFDRAERQPVGVDPALVDRGLPKSG
jgi:hypothetical protein